MFLCKKVRYRIEHKQEYFSIQLVEITQNFKFCLGLGLPFKSAGHGYTFLDVDSTRKMLNIRELFKEFGLPAIERLDLTYADLITRTEIYFTQIGLMPTLFSKFDFRGDNGKFEYINLRLSEDGKLFSMGLLCSIFNLPTKEHHAIAGDVVQLQNKELQELIKDPRYKDRCVKNFRRVLLRAVDDTDQRFASKISDVALKSKINITAVKDALESIDSIEELVPYYKHTVLLLIKVCKGILEHEKELKKLDKELDSISLEPTRRPSFILLSGAGAAGSEAGAGAGCG